MTRFVIGDHVIALVDGQGMARAARYMVEGVDVRDLGPFGSLVTYTLTAEKGGEKLEVRNGHLLLERVEGDAS